MKPADAFAAFQDLKDLTQASDAELAGMLAYGPMATPIANYEDAVTERLLRLFRAITGVPWIRGWEHGARPTGQYGTIWLYSTKLIGLPTVELARVIQGSTNTVLTDLCEVARQPIEYRFQLDVYRDGGAATRNQQGASDTAPRLSAADVLLRLAIAANLTRVRQALSDACLAFGSPAFGQVRNLAKELAKNTYETHANVDLYIRAAPVASMRSPTYGVVDWGFLCPDENTENVE